jgi:hypothetical protein
MIEKIEKKRNKLEFILDLQKKYNLSLLFQSSLYNLCSFQISI